MSNIKISALASASALDGTEEVPIVQSATTVKTTTQDIANLGGGSSYLVKTYVEMQNLAGSFIPGGLYLITDAYSGAAQLLIAAYDADNLEPMGQGFFQNAAMSSSVKCIMWYYFDTDKITGIYEPTLNNLVTGKEYYSAIDNFPFDNSAWYDNRLTDVNLISIGTGSYMFRVIAEGGTLIDFEDKINCSFAESNLGGRVQVVFTKNSGAILELTAYSTAVVYVGDLIEAVVLQSGAALGTFLKVFSGANNLIVGNNSAVSADTNDSYSITHSSIGQHCTITVGGSFDAVTIGDGITLTTVAPKTNAQFLNIAGTVYQLGVSGGNVTAT